MKNKEALRIIILKDREIKYAIQAILAQHDSLLRLGITPNLKYLCVTEDGLLSVLDTVDDPEARPLFAVSYIISNAKVKAKEVGATNGATLVSYWQEVSSDMLHKEQYQSYLTFYPDDSTRTQRAMVTTEYELLGTIKTQPPT